jgi:hypothetical protein
VNEELALGRAHGGAVERELHHAGHALILRAGLGRGFVPSEVPGTDSSRFVPHACEVPR